MKISKGKVAVDILLLTGVFTSCTMWKMAQEHTSVVEAAQVKTAEVQEVNTGSTQEVEYTIPYGDTSFKSYMDWRCITNENSPQYKLQKGCWTDKQGLRRFGDEDYVIALGSYYATEIGQRFEITLSTGESFTAVVGDFKADKHTDKSNRYTPTEDGGKNVIEFVVDVNRLDSMAKKMGDISYIEGFDGDIRSIHDR